METFSSPTFLCCFGSANKHSGTEDKAGGMSWSFDKLGKVLQVREEAKKSLAAEVLEAA